jgi:hypothetical protein
MSFLRIYTPDEEAQIRARYPTEGGNQLAIDLGRSAVSIRRKARYLGVKRAESATYTLPHTHQWTEAEDTLIRREWPNIYRRRGKTAEQLAQQLNVPLHQLRNRAAHLGVVTMKAAERIWTEEEDNYLCDHAYLGLYTLEKRFRQKNWPRTRNALACRLNRLGQRIRGENIERYSAKGLAELLDIAPATVMRWIKNGWLPAKPRTAGTGPQGQPVEWAIHPADAAWFLQNHTAQVDLSRADKFWLVDLLSTHGAATRTARKCSRS